MKVLSLFDGMSCGLQALKEAGIPINIYYASEIDKYAIHIAKKNHPEIIELGDVKNWRERNLGEIDMVIGGSPCQDLSIAGKRAGLDGARSGLFWDMVDIIAHYKPKYFLLENVASMSKENKAIITEAMGVDSILINSALLTAQNRKRLYRTNIPGITQPEDKGIVIKDILEEKVDEKYYLNDSLIEKLKYLKGAKKEQRVKEGHEYTYSEGVSKITQEEKSLPILASGAGTVGRCATVVRIGGLNKQGQGDRVYSDEGKSISLSAHGGGRGAKTGLYSVAKRGRYNKNGNIEQQIEIGGNKANSLTSVQKDSMALLGDRIRKLTPTECERLQGLKDNYSEGVSNSQRYKMIGNGRTIPVISWIFSFITTPVE